MADGWSLDDVALPAQPQAAQSHGGGWSLNDVGAPADHPALSTPSSGGFWRNVGAGLEEIPGGIANLLANSNPDAMPFEVRDAATAGQGVAGRIGNATGLKPSQVSENTFTDKLGRNLPGAALSLIPGEGDVSLANMARQGLTGLGSVLGQTTAQTVAPDSPAAQIAGALAGGLTTGKMTQAPSAIRRATSPISPEARASQYVTDLAASSGKTPADIAAYGPATFGKPVTGAEAIGRPGISSLTALGRRAGTTGDALTPMLAERAQGAPERILADFATDAGIDPHAAIGDIDTVVSNGRAAAKPLYEKAFQDNNPVWTNRLQQFLDDPVMKEGFTKGLRVQRLEALRDGVPFDPHDYNITDFAPDGSPIISGTPNMRLLDAGNRGLNQILRERADNNLGRLPKDEDTMALLGVKNAYLKELDTLNPAYGAARAQASDYLGAKQAFDQSAKMFSNPNVTAKQFDTYISGLDGSEATAAQGGPANWLFNQAQRGNLKGTTFSKPILQQKLTTLIGDPDKAATFLQRMKAESDMAKSGSRMAPGVNSPTYELQEAGADQDKLGAAISTGRAVAHLGAGNYLGAAQHGVGALQKLGAFAQTPGMSVPVRDAAGRLLMSPPAELASNLSDYGATQLAQQLAKPKFPLAGLLPAAMPAINQQQQSPYKRGGMI